MFETGWLGMGSTVFEFEKTLGAYLGARNVIAVNSGTTALHLALDGLGIRHGDEVILPSLTFCASAQVITALGGTPVFCEISPDTLNMDLADVRRRITKRTKAIMPVHYCGTSCDMDGLLAMGKEHAVSIVEDAAHAFGSSYKGRKIGSFGQAICFSFDPIKTLTCGEGGAIVLADDAVAELVRRKRSLGIDKDTWSRYKTKQSWYYEVTTQGYRYHMSNINAAIGLVQFRKLDRFIARKREIVEQYNRRFAPLDGVSILHWDLNETAPFCYIMRVTDGRRDALIDFLGGRGIGSGVHYIPNHDQPFFKAFAAALPVTDAVAKEIVTLPLYVDMTPDDVRAVGDAVTTFFNGA